MGDITQNSNWLHEAYGCVEVSAENPVYCSWDYAAWDYINDDVKVGCSGWPDGEINE